MKTPLSSSLLVDGSGLGEFGGDLGLPAFGVSRRELIRLDGFDSFWASFNSLKYSSPDEKGRGGVTRSGQLCSRFVVSSIHESVEILRLEILDFLSLDDKSYKVQTRIESVLSPSLPFQSKYFVSAIRKSDSSSLIGFSVPCVLWGA